MNSFEIRKKRRTFSGFLLPLLAFILILCFILYGISSISANSAQREQEELEQAIYRDVVHCYASEGFYPPSLSYLKEHYGLTWREDRYFIDYQPIGPNLMPDVTVIRLGGAE